MNVYEIITQRIIEKLEAGTVPWRKPWKGGADGVPRNLKPIGKISGDGAGRAEYKIGEV